MAENKFEIGDVVHLNSGSPDMTVEDVFPKTNNVQTCWFNEVGEKRIALFHPDCLHLVLTDEEIILWRSWPKTAAALAHLNLRTTDETR